MQINPALSVNDNIIALLNNKNPGKAIPFSLSNLAVGAYQSVNTLLFGGTVGFTKVNNSGVTTGTFAEITATGIPTVSRINISWTNSGTGLAYAAELKISYGGALADQASIEAALALVDGFNMLISGRPSWHYLTPAEKVPTVVVNGDQVTLTLTHNSVNSGSLSPSGATAPIQLVSLPEVNTKVTLTAIVNQGYAGTKDIFYKRLSAEEASLSLPAGFVEILPEDSAAVIKEKVIAALGLVTSEVSAGPMGPATTAEVPGYYTVDGSITGKLYLQGMRYVVRTRYPQQSMEDAIVDVEMDGFDTPSE